VFCKFASLIPLRVSLIVSYMGRANWWGFISIVAVTDTEGSLISQVIVVILISSSDDCDLRRVFVVDERRTCWRTEERMYS